MSVLEAKVPGTDRITYLFTRIPDGSPMLSYSTEDGLTFANFLNVHLMRSVPDTVVSRKLRSFN